MNSELEELYQEVILDHSRKPRNFGKLADASMHVHGDNPSCGDEIDLEIKFGPDGSLQELKFSGHGCAISQASASMMTMKLRGKSPRAAEEMLCAFHDLVARGGTDSSLNLGDLGVMRGVRKFPQRVKCAMLAWRALEEALRQRAGAVTVSTEREFVGPEDD